MDKWKCFLCGGQVIWQGYWERTSMSKEIEADGYITRQVDLKQTERKVCANCKHLKHDDILRRYRCSVGHLIDVADWRMKYEVCDKWEKR